MLHCSPFTYFDWEPGVAKLNPSCAPAFSVELPETKLLEEDRNLALTPYQTRCA